MVLVINSSKTTQTSSPPRYIPVAPLKDKAFCAVFWLKRWLMYAPASPSAPLFRLGRLPISYTTFQLALADLVSKAGIRQKISSHSFRRGGATSLSAIGKPIEQIKERGGWRSDVVLTYISEPIQVKMGREEVVSQVIDKLLS